MKDVLKIVLSVVLPFGLLILLFLFLRKKMNPVKQLSEEQQKAAIEASKTKMNNGRTFYAVADEIYNHLYLDQGWLTFFALKDTDEKALGALLLTVTKDEYPKLSEVYQIVKQANKTGEQRPLTEELYKTFNEKERRQYLSHLLDNVL